MKLRPLIPQKLEQVTVRFPVSLYQQVLAYKDVLGEATDRNYVIVEAVRAFLASDKEFQHVVARRKTTHDSGRPEALAGSLKAQP